MEGEALRQGKARVMQHLIIALEDRGMTRKRSVSLADHGRFRDALCARLAYMTEPNLIALAEVVERYAEGPRRNVWPSEVSICNWACRMQTPPASQSRLVRTYLQSAAGDAAEAGGYLVELLGHLKQFGTPPNSFALARMREDAQDNARRIEAVSLDRDRGAASPADLQWQSDYMAARQLCLDIRAAKTKGEAA